MHFRVAARAILELGAELISSDAVAFYELIKNAIDARSKRGVEIAIVNTLSRKNLLTMQGKADEDETELEDLIEDTLTGLESDALPEHVATCKERLDAVKTVAAFKKEIEALYEETTYITVRDWGSGMSLKTLQDAFLTVGTSNRQAEVLEALKQGKGGTTPYLGEKGVGRLSTMRLGEVLEVRTATADDSRYNCLEIDWGIFNDSPDSMLDSIEVSPERGEQKDRENEHGTTLTIRRLNSSWKLSYIKNIATTNFSRIIDPFDLANEQFAIRIKYNGQDVNYVSTIRTVLLKHSHGRIKGKYEIRSGRPHLSLTLSCPLYGATEQKAEFDGTDLSQTLLESTKEVADRSLVSVGPFSFDVYWFNRKFLPNPPPPGFETVKQFRGLLDKWMGIMLYRDGYQVLPYGDAENDWLSLDRKALQSPGFKLNKIQFVGRVNTTRLGNPALIDQTNREGLRDCDEKQVLVGVLQFAIQNEFKAYIREADEARKPIKYDERKSRGLVEKLAADTEKALGKVQGANREDRELIRRVTDLFEQIHAQYILAADRVKSVEDEHEQLVQLAGIGLAVETVAHELARIVQHTHELLRKQNLGNLTADARTFFDNIRSQVGTIEKRLRVIDPLSVSGRNRKTEFDLRELVQRVVDSRDIQLKRHEVTVKIEPGKSSKVMIRAVEGKIIQILENLLSNSIYWVDVWKEEHPRLEGEIAIRVKHNPPGFEFSDNGLGVPLERAERIFQPFYSTRKASKRRGLGLYIAQENAVYHGGELFLDTSKNKLPNGRYSTFILELPQSEGK